MDRSGTSGGQDAGLMCGSVWYKRRAGRWFNVDRSGASGGQDAGLMCGPVWYKRRAGRWFNVWSGLVQAEGRTLV